MRSALRIGTIVTMDSPISQPESPYEIIRRLENLLRLGTVAEVAHQRARCRVRTGELVTGWLPWINTRAGGESGRTWWPPVVGEQCMLLAPGGDLLNAVALCGVFSTANPAGSDRPTECRTDWSPTDNLRHDSDGGHLVIECVGSITLKVGGTTLQLTPEGAFVSPDMQGAGRVSLVHHKHTDVRRGSDTTGEPE